VPDVPHVPDAPGVADSGDAGLRAANARLRERDARISVQDAEIMLLREQLAGRKPGRPKGQPRTMGTGIYLWHGQFLSRDRACRALSELFGCAPAPGALAAAARKTAALPALALAAITRNLIASNAVHFDEVGFRTAGKLASVHSASSGKFAPVTVHAKRGKDGMTVAGVLPSFRGIAVHDAWKPYDSYGNVAGHALCNSPLAPRAHRGHRDRHGPGQGMGAAGHRRSPCADRRRRGRPRGP
jgi:hypothetical protein